MLAAAVQIVLSATNFPDGGHGFLGYTAGLRITPIRRPSIATSDAGYLRYTVGVAALMFLLLFAHARVGTRGVGTVPRREPAGASPAGQRHLVQAPGVRAGVVRHRRGRRPHGREPPPPVRERLYHADSVTLLAAVLIGGTRGPFGAILAGLVLQLLPTLMHSWGIPQVWLTIALGIGLSQALLASRPDPVCGGRARPWVIRPRDRRPAQAHRAGRSPASDDL